MTNTLNTPIEVLEHVYPVRVLRYALRGNSGGRGNFPAATASSAKSKCWRMFRSEFCQIAERRLLTVWPAELRELKEKMN